VLRIRIWDLVPFLPLDPGSGMGKKSGSGIRVGKIRIREGKKSDPGSGINISDPQHCYFETSF
jgi:hypothetical protein